MPEAAWAAGFAYKSIFSNLWMSYRQTIENFWGLTSVVTLFSFILTSPNDGSFAVAQSQK